MDSYSTGKTFDVETTTEFTYFYVSNCEILKFHQSNLQGQRFFFCLVVSKFKKFKKNLFRFVYF